MSSHGRAPTALVVLLAGFVFWINLSGFIGRGGSGGVSGHEGRTDDWMDAE
jgi:hypothetical protein